MNWVKTRLSLREDKLRMKQREFFAKKKLEKQTQMKQIHRPGSGMSLDLLAVNISNREKPKEGNQPPPNIVKVDLDKLNPYRRRVTNVDLGPLSPTKRSLALHPGINSAQRNVVSDVSPVTWQPSSFLSSQPVPASRSGSRDILPPLVPQTKFLQTTRQNENSRAKTKFEQKTQLPVSNSVRFEPESPFIPFSKPGPRVTFNNKTETWSYSCSSSSSENSSKEKSRSSASEFPKSHLQEDSSPLCSITTQRRFQRNLFKTEDFQEVSEPCATENWCSVKGCRNEDHSTNTLASDFEILEGSSCLGEKYCFKKTASRFGRGTSIDSENKGRFLPTLKSQMSKMEGNLMSFSEDNTSGEQNRELLDIHTRRYSDSQNGKLVNLCDDRHTSDRSFDTSANYATSYEMRRNLDLGGKDLVKCWISRNDDQPSTQSSYCPEAHRKEKRKSQLGFLPESPFSQSSNYKCNRRSEVEIGREDIDDWIIKEKSEKERVLKINEKMLEVEPLARKHPHQEERKLQLSPGRMKRWSKSGVSDNTSTEQRRPLCVQSPLADDSAKSFIQETKDSVGADSPSQSWSDSSSDERSSILSSCPSTKSFVQGRYGHQHRNNYRSHAGGNRPKDCIVGDEKGAAQNSWLSFVRGEKTQAPVTGSRQLPEPTAAQVVTEQNIVGNEHSCSESSTNSCKKSSDEKRITLTFDVRDRISPLSTATKECDSDSHKREMAEESESSSLRMATPTLGDRSSCRLATPTLGDRSSCRLANPTLGDRGSCRLATPILGDRSSCTLVTVVDNNSLLMATAKLVDTICLSCQNITGESPETNSAAVCKSDETVNSAACIKEQSTFGIRNKTKSMNNLDEMTEGEFCIMDDDVHLTANILTNDKPCSADNEPPPKRYKCFREPVIGESSSVSIVNCETQTRSESPVLMTTDIQTSSLDVLSSCIHSSHSRTLLVTAGTQTSPLTANACTSPAVNSWTVDAQSSPMFGHLQPLLQSYTSLNCLGVDVSLSPVFQPVTSSDAQLSPIFQCKTTDAQLSPIYSFFSTNAQQSPLLAENPKLSPLQKCLASAMQSLPTSSETASDLQTFMSSCDQPLLPLCAEVNTETVYAAECSAQSKPVQNPSDTQVLHESNICLDIKTNKHDDVCSRVDAKLEGFGYSVVAAFDGKPQMTTEEHTPRLSCCVVSDDPSVSDVSFRSMMDRFQQNEDEVDKTDRFGYVLPAKETVSCSGGLQSNTSFKPIEDKVLEVLDVHDQCSKAMESCIATSFQLDKLYENNDLELKDSVPSEDPNGVKVPDLVLFSSDLDDSSCTSADTKKHHSLDSPESSSVYSSPMG